MGAKTFQPVNRNGAQRGFRPIVQYFGKRLKNTKIIEDNGLGAVITDDFILVPNPRQYDANKKYVVTFSAE